MIALIAHEKKKAALLEFARGHFAYFRTQQLVATGHTGKLLHDELGLEIERVAHGPEGGDLLGVSQGDTGRRSGGFQPPKTGVALAAGSHRYLAKRRLEATAT